MTPERWRQVEEIFQTALDLAPDERAQFVARACAGDAGLRAEVEALLAQHEEAEGFLDESPLGAEGMRALAGDDEADRLIGSRLGAYRIEREIGRGGMGVVYLATRADSEFRRSAAVKVIKRGMDTDFILRRFRNERQILATLEHHNIALLLDGGATETGQPYFVMEYIEGEPIYAYCDARRLALRERLRLFLQVCDAVQHAHRNQVIHRDIKPSNILVTPAGVPKLFDFGIAKLLNPELSPDTAPLTATALRMMTVEYASPEQVRGLPVTFLSDVYSLGVLLYELLTGHRPFRFRSRLPHEVARVVTEQEPVPPSEAVTSADNPVPLSHAEQRDAPTAEQLSSLRGATPDELSRALAGGLDRVVLKAIRKDPAERYQSAAALREDIERHLEGRAVVAPPIPRTASPTPTGEARADEPARRSVLPTRPSTDPRARQTSEPPQTGGEKSIAVLPLKIIGASTGGTEDEFLGVGLADALTNRLSNVSRFVVRPTSSVLNFAATTDSFAAGRELGVDFVLDGSIRRAGERLRVSVQLLNVLTNSTAWAQSFDEKSSDVLEFEDSISARVADSLLPQLTGEERRQLSKRGTNDPEAYAAYLRGRYFWNQFTPETFHRVLEEFRRAVHIDPAYAHAHVGIASYYNWASIFGFVPSQEGYEKTRAAARRALEIDDSLGEAYAVLGFTTAFADWDWAEAERLLKKSLDLNPHNGLAHEWYAALLAGVGRDEEATREILRAEEFDPFSLRPMVLTAWTLYQLRRFPQALAKAEEIIDMNPHFWQGHLQRGNILLEMARAEDALASLRRAYQSEPESGISSYKLCFALAATNRREEAREVFRRLEAVAATRYVNHYHLGMCHAALGERDAAFAEFERGIAARDLWSVWLATEPKLDPLRADPRFDELLRRTKRRPPARADAPSRESAPRETTGGEKSIAVLPLKILGAATGDADDYLGVGLADTLITRLSNVRRFAVRPTASVLRFAETADPFAAGRELAVRYVLDGYIRRAGPKLRITLQLLDVENASAVWAEQFVSEGGDVLSLEDSIAARVARSLVPHLSGEEQERIARRGTENAEAYELYLRGRFYFNLMTEEGFARAVGYYERAVALDPTYALAYTAIVEYYIFLGVQCVLPFGECARRSKEAAERAASLDPLLAEAQAALGVVAINHDFDWSRAEDYNRRAVEMNPNSFMANQWLKTLYLQTGRFAEALRQAERLMEIAPDWMMSLHFLAWTHHNSRRLADSIRVHRQLIADSPLYAFGRLTFSWTLRCAGEFGEAVEQARKGAELAPRNPLYLAGLAAAQAGAGLNGEARETLSRVGEMAAAQYVSPYMLSIAHCALGERDRAFELLEEALTIRDVWIVWIGVEPQFDPLRTDARFGELLRRMKHPLAS